MCVCARVWVRSCVCVVVASVIHTIKCSGLSPMYALQISPIFDIYYKACVCAL